jgi:galactokinase
MAERLAASAPGRICLFGEHQDFLGLEVIAAAINLRMEVAGTPRQGAEFHLAMPDIGDEDAFDPNHPQQPRSARDYLRQAANVLRREGVKWTRGWDCAIRSAIPINAGCASSSALTVAWVAFLLEAAGVEYVPVEVARLAHRAEVVEFGEPGGMMDHYTSSLGGMLHIDCRPSGDPEGHREDGPKGRPSGDPEPRPLGAKGRDPIRVTPLEARPDGLVLGDSLQKKETTAVLAQSKRDVLEGVRLLAGMIPGFDLRETPLEQAAEAIRRLPRQVGAKVEANLINRDLERLALGMLGDPKRFDAQGFGRLLTAHHRELSVKLGVSTEKLDRMCRAALAAGALGAKVNGSGGGGTMFAFAPSREEAVAAAIEGEGGRAHRVYIDQGLCTWRTP